MSEACWRDEELGGRELALFQEGRGKRRNVFCCWGFFFSPGRELETKGSLRKAARGERKRGRKLSAVEKGR